jgi:hypothetical protein
MPHPLKFPDVPEPPREPPPFHVAPPMVFVPPRWEYKHLIHKVTDEAPINEEELNALGSEGWELAAFYTGPSSVHFYFKRLIR